MKKIIVFLIICCLLIPNIIKADYDESYQDSYNYINKYIKSLDNYELYILNSNGALITENEYNISNGKNSYLFDGQSYWINNKYIHGASGNVMLSDNNKSGLRVCTNLLLNLDVTGNGTYADPWEFNVDKNAIVTFDSNGGSTPTPYIEKEVLFGKAYSAPDSFNRSNLPTTTRTGYAFEGWYNGDELILNSSIVKTNKNHSLTAKWKAQSYKITYNCNGGGGSTNDSTHNLGDDSKLTKNGCTPMTTDITSEYKFVGWAKNSTESDPAKIFADQAKASSLGIENAGSTTTLYAIWKKYNYVARIGSVRYETIQAAFDAVPANNVLTDIYLLKSVTQSGENKAGRYSRFNFQNFTVTGNITNSATLILKGGGTLTNPSTVAFTNNATATITSANISGYVSAGVSNIIRNTGNLTINGSTNIVPTSGTCGPLVYNIGGTITMTSGKITNNLTDGGSCMCGENGGTYNIGGTAELTTPGNRFSRAVCSNAGNGNINISGSAKLSGVQIKTGKLTMTGGTVSGTCPWPLAIYDNASVNISGGSSTGSDTAISFYDEHAGGTISGGTFVGQYLAAISYGSHGYAPTGQLNITGGSFTGKRFAIYVDSGYGTTASTIGVINISGSAKLISQLEDGIFIASGIVNFRNSASISSPDTCKVSHYNKVWSKFTRYGGTVGNICTSN